LKGKHNSIIGKVGEIIAENFLLQEGFKILCKNYRTRYGEIDIICKKNYGLYFFEVKSRINDDLVKPFESVNKKKIERIIKTAYYFLRENNGYIDNNEINVKIISITFGDNLSTAISLMRDPLILDYNKIKKGGDYRIEILDIYE